MLLTSACFHTSLRPLLCAFWGSVPSSYMPSPSPRCPCLSCLSAIPETPLASLACVFLPGSNKDTHNQPVCVPQPSQYPWVLPVSHLTQRYPEPRYDGRAEPLPNPTPRTAQGEVLEEGPVKRTLLFMNYWGGFDPEKRHRPLIRGSFCEL